MHQLRMYTFRAALAAGGMAGVSMGTTALKRKPTTDATSRGLRLSAPLIDAICGAAGEISQICILYPLETVKVRCQAESINAGEVVARLVRQGLGPDTLRQLYSGFGSAALFSMLVGAVHWLSFCAAKRAAMRALVPTARPSAAASLAGQAAPTASTSGRGSEEVNGGSGKRPERRKRGKRSKDAPAALGGDAATASIAGESSQLAVQLHELATAEQQLAAKTTANLIASLAGALATALVESPVELFRHQAQAGLIGGNLVREMQKSVRKGGPFALYFGFLPYCLESFPYDISELGTYSQLRDVYGDCSRPSHRLAPLLAKHLPPALADLAIGAAAGAAAVMVSMPFDCIKTYIQTNVGPAAGVVAGTGVAGGIRAFVLTGAGMVARKGPGALFVGVVPRLLQQVPSSTICWWTVEQCHRALRPYMDDATLAAMDEDNAGH